MVISFNQTMRRYKNRKRFYRKRNARRQRVRTAKRRYKRSFATAVKRVMVRTLEPRQFVVPVNNIAAATHRLLVYCTPINMTTGATVDANRTGNEVFVKGIALKMLLNRSQAFYNDIRFRVTAFWQPKNSTDWAGVISQSWSTATTGMTGALFDNEGSGLETITREQQGIVPIYDRNFINRTQNVGSTVSTIQCTARPVSVYIPCNFRFRFRRDTSNIPLRQFFVCIYWYGGGLGASDTTTALTQVSCSYKVYFRDT